MKRKASRKPKPARSKRNAAKSIKTRRRAAPVASPARDAMDALVSTSAQALKLPLDPAWHAGIKFNLALILRFGALVDEFPLPDDAEPAPVFYA